MRRKKAVGTLCMWLAGARQGWWPPAGVKRLGMRGGEPQGWELASEGSQEPQMARKHTIIHVGTVLHF